MQCSRLFWSLLVKIYVRCDSCGQVTERFRDRVVDEGYSPSYGARPLRRAIMRLLEDSMAERMLAGEIKEGDSAIIDVDSEGGVTVLNGTTGTASSTAIEAPAGIAWVLHTNTYQNVVMRGGQHQSREV